jgi:cytochrome c oxidase subunit IV
MERDDVIEYSLDTHHSEEEGKVLRKKIWKVTGILTLVTFVEVVLGANIGQDSILWPYVKLTFVILTLLKAAYIILSFMHLGDERKLLKYIILTPYVLFMAYLIFILLFDGTAVGNVRTEYGV